MPDPTFNEWLEAHSAPTRLPVAAMDAGPVAQAALDQAEETDPQFERQLALLEKSLHKLEEARNAMASLEQARTAGLNLGWRAGRRSTLWWALPLGMALGACIFAIFATLGARS